MRSVSAARAYPTLVHKSSVYLTDKDLAKLARLSDREGISQAEVIRRAIRTAPERTRDRRLALIGVVGS